MPDNILLEIIQQILRKRPGLPARTIAYRARSEFRVEATRRDINRLLYRYRNLFQREGASPPLWSLRSSLESTSATPARINLNRANQAVGTPAVGGAVANQNLADYHLPATTPEVSLYRKPRQWQENAIASWKRNGNGKGIVEAVTGTGKTFVATWILAQYVNAKLRSLVLVPSITLFNQWRENLEHDLGLEVTSLLGAGHKNSLDLSCPITIGVLKSGAIYEASLRGKFCLLVADECHRYAGATYRKALLASAPHRLGLTATLERSDEGVEEVLKPYFSGVVFTYDFADAKRDKMIARHNTLLLSVDLLPHEFEEYTAATDTLGNAGRDLFTQFGYPRDSFGEFMSRAADAAASGGDEGDAARAFLGAMAKRKQILSETQSKIRAVPLLAQAIKRARKTIVFCETIDSAEYICEEFENAGVATAVYHSKLTRDELNEILERFQETTGYDQVDCLVAVRALDEGIDIPIIDCGIIIASTKQRRQMVQRMGRVVRLKPDGRGATLIALYARNTFEDPSNFENLEDSHLHVLTDTADHCEDRGLDEVSADFIADFIAKSYT